MTRVRPSPQQKEIERYLGSGEHDAMHVAWSGDHFMECGRIGAAALREALIATVRQRSTHAVAPPALEALDMTTFGRARLAPMVGGLFPPDELGKTIAAVQVFEVRQGHRRQGQH